MSKECPLCARLTVLNVLHALLMTTFEVVLLLFPFMDEETEGWMG